MPRNSTGKYFLPDGNPVADGELITAEWANSTLSDIATAITDSLDREGLGGMNAPLEVADGSLSKPGMNFTNESNTGLYRPAAKTVGVAVGGVEVATVTQSGMQLKSDKQLVIPQAPVDANDAANKTYVDNAKAAAKSYADTAASNAESDAKSYAASKASTAQSNAESYADGRFLPKSDPVVDGKLIVTRDGESVKINSPITDKTSATSYITFNYNNGSDRLGYVGFGSANSTNFNIYNEDGSINFYSTETRFNSDAKFDLDIYVDGTTSSASVVCSYGVGLNVGAKGKTNGFYFREGSGNRYFNAATKSAFNQLDFFTPGGLAGRIQTTDTTCYYATTSDYRLKENVHPMQHGLEKVAQLKPVTYTWKGGGSGQGFIAHELAEVIPDAVIGEKDATLPMGDIKDADGNIVSSNVEKDAPLEEGQTWEYTHEGIDPQGIDTSFLVATLTAAIQEQQAQIDALQAEVKAVKAKQVQQIDDDPNVEITDPYVGMMAVNKNKRLWIYLEQWQVFTYPGEPLNYD